MQENGLFKMRYAALACLALVRSREFTHSEEKLSCPRKDFLVSRKAI
jgi:hypothetical protein